MPERSEPQALLGDLRSLRDRARADRRGYAFPLFLFAGLILFAPVLYTPAPPPPSLDEMIVVDEGPFPQFTPMLSHVSDPWLVDWYWILVIVGGLAATGWWYRRRARRLGVETNIRVTFAAAGAALLGLLAGPRLLQYVVVGDDLWPVLYSAPSVNLPILFGAAILSALTFGWGSRPQRTDRARTAAVFAGTLLGMVAFSALCVYFFMGFAGLLVIAVALLVLAWWERSVLLAVVAVLFTAVSVPANHSLWEWDLPYVFGRLGWQGGWDDARVFAFQTLLVPGLVLVAGGVTAVLTRHGSTR
jgi:hypothetical protein